MARRVLLHVGAPKTGTSFVQDILFTHRAELGELGICYPADRFDAHFLAALDLMQLPWGGLEREARGAWERLAEEVRRWPGTAIISHEILGTASRQHVARALASMGGAEVHLVFSARDLVRQIPAEWQENLKHRRTTSYRDFLGQVMDEQRAGALAQWFWGVQEVPDVLDRWGAALSPERVHLVTVPPSGSAPLLLWERFAGVFGLDPGRFAPGSRSNASLGVPEAALLRRLNKQLRDVVPSRLYRPLVRELLVHQSLATARASERLTVPPEVWQWASAVSRTWVEELSGREYDVVGDLADLIPTDPLPHVDPDRPDESAVAAVATRALSVMTTEAARLRDREAELSEMVAELTGQLDKLRGTRTYQAKESLVAMADTNPLARSGLRAYRRLRGRSSRST
ncbi:MAG: hypothetical protein M3130_04225 [Actinomycetota bacterium]|nr:hypothetical protein [Actinomycetota bacterium]